MRIWFTGVVLKLKTMVLNSGCKFENLGAQRKKSLPQRGCKFEDPTREDENPFRNGLYFFGAGGRVRVFPPALPPERVAACFPKLAPAGLGRQPGFCVSVWIIPSWSSFQTSGENMQQPLTPRGDFRLHLQTCYPKRTTSPQRGADEVLELRSKARR